MAHNTGNPPQGWHPDPSNPQQLRWWDGQAWTQNTHPIDQLVEPQSGASSETIVNQQATAVQPQPQSQLETPTKEYFNPSKIREKPGRRPTTGGSALIGIVVIVITTIVLSIYGGAALMIILAVVSNSAGGDVPGYLSIVVAVFGIGGLVLSLWLSGWLTSLFFNSNGYQFSSRWNLVVAYPVAAVITTVVAGILSGLVFFLAVGSENAPSGMVMLLIFVTYLAILVYFLGKSIVWASGWSQNTAMILTIIYGLLTGGAIILMSLFVLLSAQLIGSIGSIKSPGVEITSKQAKSVKKGARLAVVTKRFGKPLSQKTTDLGSLGKQTCLFYSAQGDSVLQMWQFCFKGSGPNAKLQTKSKSGL